MVSCGPDPELCARTNVLCIRTNVLFIRTNVLCIRTNVLFIRTNVLCIRTNVLFIRMKIHRILAGEHVMPLWPQGDGIEIRVWTFEVTPSGCPEEGNPASGIRQIRIPHSAFRIGLPGLRPDGPIRIRLPPIDCSRNE